MKKQTENITLVKNPKNTNAYGKRNRQLTNKQSTTQAVREPIPRLAGL